MNGSTLEKKSNLEFLEKDVGLHKFLPSSVLNTVKPKTLRKSLQQHFKKYGQLSESECFFKFLELLGKGRKYDQESFRCALGVSSLCGLTLTLSLSLCLPCSFLSLVHKILFYRDLWSNMRLTFHVMEPYNFHLVNHDHPLFFSIPIFITLIFVSSSLSIFLVSLYFK